MVGCRGDVQWGYMEGGYTAQGCTLAGCAFFPFLAGYSSQVMASIYYNRSSCMSSFTTTKPTKIKVSDTVQDEMLWFRNEIKQL